MHNDFIVEHLGFLTSMKFTFNLKQWSQFDLLELIFYTIGAVIIYVCIPLL